MRALKFVGAVFAALLVLAGLLLFVGIPSGFLTSRIQEQVERETGYRLTIAGTTRISLWPNLNVRITDLTLQDPQRRETSSHLTIGSVEADLPFASLWSGKPKISELAITRPELRAPLLRERTASSGPAGSGASTGTPSVTIEHVSVNDGRLIFSNVRDRVESRIEAINADATIGDDRQLKLTATARSGGGPVKMALKAKLPAPPVQRQTTPVELVLEMPDLLRGPLTASAEARMNGNVVMINGISGMHDNAAFAGWASVDITSKPLVKLDLDFQRISVAPGKSDAGPAQPDWSSAPIDFSGLNYVDGQLRLTAAEIAFADARIAPAAFEAALAGGVMKASATNLQAFGGQATGELIIDVTSATPSFAMNCDLVDVRALPLLRDLADFDRLDGRMQAKIGVRSSGASPRTIMSNVSGTAFLNLQDGAIRGLNVAKMIRSLTMSTLSGWQDAKDEATDLSQFSSSFKIERGQASTTDLNLVGPLVRMTGVGTIDLGTKRLLFRVEPKLVMSLTGQGRTQDPVGFGIPVLIDGTWSQPRIYPEMQGILDNPDAAYAKLREMGKGLFGPGGAGLDSLLGGLTGLGSAGKPSGGATTGGSQTNPLGGIGEAIGSLIQGLGTGSAPATGTGTRNSRSMPAPGSPAAAEPPAQAAPGPSVSDLPPPASTSQDEPQDSQAMKEIMRRLFNNR